MPGLEGAPATKPNISYIDGDLGALSYRGYPLEVLAERSTFEETVLVLLDGELPTRTNFKVFDQDMRDNRRAKFRIRELCANGHPTLTRWICCKKSVRRIKRRIFRPTQVHTGENQREYVALELSG